MGNIIVTGNNPLAINAFKVFLQRHFHIKDLGPHKYFLRIEVAHSKKGIFLSQRKYTIEILDETGFLGTHPTTFPMEQNLKLTPEDVKFLYSLLSTDSCWSP